MTSVPSGNLPPKRVMIADAATYRASAPAPPPITTRRYRVTPPQTPIIHGTGAAGGQPQALPLVNVILLQACKRAGNGQCSCHGCLARRPRAGRRPCRQLVRREVG